MMETRMGMGRSARLAAALALALQPYSGLAQYTDLGRAVHDGDLDRVQRLIDAGADADAKQGPFDWTPLMSAIVEGDAEIAAALIKASKDLDARNIDKETAVIVAVFSERTEILRLLIDAGADVDAADTNSQTALMFAAMLEYTDGVDALIGADANLDARNRLLDEQGNVVAEGATALMIAAETGNVGIVGALVDAGATIDLETSSGVTAQMLALAQGHSEVFSLLAEAEAAQRP